ncbi:hypothetical protein AAZX31_02G260100 [Glycine max]|nr:hypothetical protein GLYMA_02G276500v4 [Glycine max]KAG4402766.1 hypothetical protein GLYMA_02G276500v4 [Glycine max]KAH1062411.1 hypothetical protein GYH30_005415 [Glycine max]KAH1062412.1 hypothetical protein GYH30_005415 [Glycine max]
MFGANQKMIEAQAARKKEEYLNNPELAQISELYKSEKVGFKIETITGSSLKTVALKSAMKLKANWLILDRKMKNDEEYFLRKLSCGILRVRRFNKILRLREPLHLPQETQPGSTHETYTDSIPLPDTSTEHDLYVFSAETSPNSQGGDNQMNQEQGHTLKSLHDEEGFLTPDQLNMEEKDNSIKHMESQTQRSQHWQDEQKENRNNGNERDPKPKQKLEEKNCDITCSGSKRETEQKIFCTKVYQKGGERCSSFGGARNFYLGGAEEYTVCEQFFSLSNFHVKN